MKVSSQKTKLFYGILLQLPFHLPCNLQHSPNTFEAREKSRVRMPGSVPPESNLAILRICETPRSTAKPDIAT